MTSHLFVHTTGCVLYQIRTSTMVVLAALHIGWLKFLAVFLSEKKNVLKFTGKQDTTKQ